MHELYFRSGHDHDSVDKGMVFGIIIHNKIFFSPHQNMAVGIPYKLISEYDVIIKILISAQTEDILLMGIRSLFFLRIR